MFEAIDRWGLARTGVLDTGRGRIATPNVLFLDRHDSPIPPWAEAVLTAAPRPDGLVVDLSEEAPPDRPSLARPLSLDRVEFPTPPDEGEIAYVASAGEARAVPQEVVALQNTVEYLRRPQGFVRALKALREAAGYQRALYAPLLATPANLPLLVYSGVDLADVLRILYDSAQGRFHTAEGPIRLGAEEPAPCLCPACERDDLREHNLRQLLAELRKTRKAVRDGSLRELVEARIANDPWMTSVLRELDLRLRGWQEHHVPVAGPALRAYAPASLTRPEVVRFRDRVKERHRKPPSAEVLLLLPCSARKPYSRSRSHRLFRTALRDCGNPWTVHVVVVTSPLGLVPLELELFYPAQHYDVPVTGDWSRDEAAVLEEDLATFLRRNAYDRIVVHLGAEEPLVASILDDVPTTGGGEPRSPESLRRLKKTLREAVGGRDPVPTSHRRTEDLEAMARFQFGEGGEALVDGARTKGRYPYWRILRGGTQVAALTGERGLLALTLAGGRRLSDQDLAWVEIDDFHPEGNVFAVGVEDAHPSVRVGDDVVVRHGDEVRGVGVARMPPAEMRESNRGEAVRVRHRLRAP